MKILQNSLTQQNAFYKILLEIHKVQVLYFFLGTRTVEYLQDSTVAYFH